jgi:hypothetical protein
VVIEAGTIVLVFNQTALTQMHLTEECWRENYNVLLTNYFREDSTVKNAYEHHDYENRRSMCSSNVN